MSPCSPHIPRDLLPRVAGVRVDDAQVIDQTFILQVCSTSVSAAFPRCLRRSGAIHSRYQRKPTDLPWGGFAVRLLLHVRKFFCRNKRCGQRIFAERLPELVAPRARRTTRLHHMHTLVAFALGGEAGARLADRLGMAVSPATLIRAIRQTLVPVQPTPRVLGVDDWAKRKGAQYGTILVDLEAHHVVDLLPDRTAATFSAWLRAHPGVEVISRDRAERYATGGKTGAPQAVHIADRWHLMHNWAEVIERILRRHQVRLRQVQIVKPLPDGHTATALLPPKSVNRRRHYADRRREQAQRRRPEWWTTIRERHAKGVALTDISRELHLNDKTVRKYANAAECPHMQAYPPRPKLITPYEPYLRARWQEGCRNGKQLFREIHAHGFKGSRVLVSMFVAQLRRDEGLSAPWLPKLARREALTPRAAAAVILRRPPDRAEHEQTTLAELRTLHADLEHAVHLSERFTALVREQQYAHYDRWLADAHASSLAEVRQFARNLRNDDAAIRAALEQPWSQGQVKGQVNRLKYVKRSMYGRAKFDLLRRRVLGYAEA